MYPFLLAPNWLLCIFPRPEANDTDDNRVKWEDFLGEMKRIRELINRVPKSDDDRPLGYYTSELTAQEKDEFRRLGNALLVISQKPFNRF